MLNKTLLIMIYFIIVIIFILLVAILVTLGNLFVILFLTNNFTNARQVECNKFELFL